MKRLILLGLTSLTLFAGFIKAIADGVDEEVKAGSETEITLPDSIRDSFYAEINAGFQSLEPIFRKGCFDCHSTSTEFPWYHKLPIIGGMMDDHIKEGREHLDLTSGFPFSGSHGQLDLLGDIREEIEEGDMPLWSYRLMHWNASPDDAEKDSIFAWIDHSIALLKSNRPDSTE